MYTADKSRLMASAGGQKVLLAGGTGFLGSHLARRLTGLGSVVHVASRKRKADSDLPVSWCQADFTDYDQTERVVKQVRPDILFCLATAGVGRPDLGLVLSTFRSDLVTTLHLLTAAAEAGTPRVIVAASLEEPVENSRMLPASPYAAAKWAGTMYAGLFHSLFRTPVTIVRPFMTYGPGQPEFKVIPYVITSFLRGRQPKLSSGQRLVDWIYVDDVVEGMIAAAISPNTIGSTIDLGSGQLLTIRSVAERIQTLMGIDINPDFGAAADRPKEVVRAADLSVARDTIGWKPTTSLDNGLTATIASFQPAARYHNN